MYMRAALTSLMHGVAQAFPETLFFTQQSTSALHSMALIMSLAPWQAATSVRQPPMASGVHEQLSQAGFMPLAPALHVASGMLAAMPMPAPPALEPPEPAAIVAPPAPVVVPAAPLPDAPAFVPPVPIGLPVEVSSSPPQAVIVEAQMHVSAVK
jgi:hypothetical protein